MTILGGRVEVVIFDNKEFDKDKAHLYHNSNMVLNNFVLPPKSNKKKVTIQLSKGENYIFIIPISEGEKGGGCTAKIQISQNGTLLREIELGGKMGKDYYEAILVKSM